MDQLISGSEYTHIATYPLHTDTTNQPFINKHIHSVPGGVRHANVIEVLECNQNSPRTQLYTQESLRTRVMLPWEWPVSRFQKQIWQRIGVSQVLKAINGSVTWSYGHPSLPWTVMTVNTITSFAPTKRGAFSGLRHSLYLAVTGLSCRQKSEPWSFRWL